MDKLYADNTKLQIASCWCLLQASKAFFANRWILQHRHISIATKLKYRVKRATAPTRTCKQTETTEEDEDPEEVGRVRELGGVGYGGESSACEGLGVHCCFFPRTFFLAQGPVGAVVESSWVEPVRQKMAGPIGHRRETKMKCEQIANYI